MKSTTLTGEAREIILNQRRLEVEIAEIAVALYRLKIGR